MYNKYFKERKRHLTASMESYLDCTKFTNLNFPIHVFHFPLWPYTPMYSPLSIHYQSEKLLCYKKKKKDFRKRQKKNTGGGEPDKDLSIFALLQRKHCKKVT